MLPQIFEMQESLNDFFFAKNGLKDLQGNPLTMQAIANSGLGANDLPNVWLKRYSDAMEDELRELREELHWKWWVSDKIDMHNIRVELIDQLHFLVSAMIAAGMTAEDVFDIYQQKHAVNQQRQQNGYTVAGKTEEDNQAISTDLR